VIIRDLSEHVIASEGLREAQAELAHVTRVTTLGELTASIAHEVNQPLATVVTYGDACLRWLDREVPRIDKAHSAVEQMIGSARHASDVIERIRALSKRRAFEACARYKSSHRRRRRADPPEINLHSISLRLDLGASFHRSMPIASSCNSHNESSDERHPGVSAVADRHRELRIRSREHGSDQILVAVEDSGIGIEPEHAAGYSTPSSRRSRMAWAWTINLPFDHRSHGGQLWATANAPTVPRFSSPCR